jgi:hypothetical protein
VFVVVPQELATREKDEQTMIANNYVPIADRPPK